jgi:hypothetical protein
MTGKRHTARSIGIHHGLRPRSDREMIAKGVRGAMAREGLAGRIGIEITTIGITKNDRLPITMTDRRTRGKQVRDTEGWLVGLVGVVNK